MSKCYKKVSRFSGLERPCGEIFFHETLSFEFPLIAGMAESLLFSLKSGIKNAGARAGRIQPSDFATLERFGAGSTAHVN